MLDDAHDETLFEFYTTSQLAELGDGAPRTMGAPRMYESLSMSPDGQHVIATFIERPFSYITAYRGFPRHTAVLDQGGDIVATLSSQALREGRGGGFFGGGGERSSTAAAARGADTRFSSSSLAT